MQANGNRETAATAPAPVTEDFATLAQRVDEALQLVNALAAEEKKRALRLKEALEAFHKFGLVKIVQRLKADPRGKELLFELVDEPSVLALLHLHGIVKPPLTARARQVLEAVRPSLQARGGDVELARIEGDTAFVRLQGACHGCSQSAVTLRDGVAEALTHNLPEIRRVEALPAEPGPALIQIASWSETQSKGWVRGPEVAALPPGRMQCFTAGAHNILLVNVDNRLGAYRNTCAHQGLPLDSGLLDAESCTLTCPWHGFRFDALTGECLTAPGAQLEPFPLRVQDGVIWVRPGD